MRDLGLTIRLVVASTVLLGVYVLVGLVFFAAWGVPGALLGLPILIGLQYLLTVQLTLWRVAAEPVTEDRYGRIQRMGDRLADELDIPTPRLYVAELGTMNAFAVGRRGNGKVVLSESLVGALSRDELEPVLAHEFTHLKHRDSVVMGLGTSIVTLISGVLFLLILLASFVSDRPWLVRAVGGVVTLVVHVFLMIFVGMLSRYREYVADETAVRTTGHADGMVSALRTVARDHEGADTAEMSASRRAMSFVGFSSGVVERLLATHPSTEKRIARIEALELGTERGGDVEAAPEEQATLSGWDREDTTPDPAHLDLLSTLRSMDEYAFEHLVADFWSELGWETSVSTGAADKGIDVTAERHQPFHEKQLIQVKRYGPDNAVSSSQVQQYAGLQVQDANADAVVIVTTGRFTSNAEEIAEQTNVKLVDGDALREMIESESVDLTLERYLGE